MRNSTLLYRRVLLWIASEMLEILTKIFRRIDVTPKSWTVYLICFDVVSCIVQDSCRA